MEWLYLPILGPAIAGISNFILGISVYRTKQKSDASNIIFTLFIWSVFCWVISIAIFLFSPWTGLAHFTAPLQYVAAAILLYFFLLFSFNFPAEELCLSKMDMLILAVPSAIAISLALFPGQIVQDFYLAHGRNAYTVGSAYAAYAFYIIGYFALAFANLIRKYLHAQGVIKIQIGHIFLGVLIPAVIGVVINLLFPWYGFWHYNWIGPTGTLIFVFLIWWSMRKYRLFGLKIILFENKYLALVKKGEEGDLLEKAKRGY